MKRALSLALIALVSLSGCTIAQTPKIVRLDVAPKAIELKTPFEYRQLLVTGVTESGDRIDLTRAAKLEVPDFVKVASSGQLRPGADGTGNIKVTVEGQSGAIPVQITGQKDDYQVSFVRDVMPALSRLGC